MKGLLLLILLILPAALLWASHRARPKYIGLHPTLTPERRLAAYMAKRGDRTGDIDHARKEAIGYKMIYARLCEHPEFRYAPRPRAAVHTLPRRPAITARARLRRRSTHVGG